LLDKLDCQQMPTHVLEKLAVLFETDVVAIWVADDASGIFSCKGISGLGESVAKELEAIGHGTPCFGQAVTADRQLIVEDFHRDSSPALAGFCEREHLPVAVFTPITCHGRTTGIVSAFYRTKREVSATITAAMQIVANLLASAIQAEGLYQDLIQIQKIDSLGNLASGIAHDLNNVHAAILACASYVKQQADPASPSYHYLEATEESAHRGAALTKQLLSFVRREGPRLTVVNLNDCIDATLKILERSFDKTFLIQRQYAHNLGLVEVDPSQLEQIILNLAVNARDAMANGGILTFTTRNVRLDSRSPHRPAVKLADGDYVVFSIRDTGHGMNEATLKHIFEPFFTTKSRGKGTGLGLSVVQSIVKSHNGEIRVASSPGKGTVFEIYLPITTKPLPVVAAAPAVAQGGKERILVAEDEEVIREMTQLGLEAMGYQVRTATDGANALSIYRESWKDIDLVIADMVMPHISGPELVAKMHEINPHVRVIVSSGYSHDQEGQRMLQHGCLGYLQKPYTTDALNQLVRSVLDSGL
jgi:signal transduction histidine kinase/CheY-like chemotaxis protein